MIEAPLTHKFIETNDIRLHVVEAGSPDGQLLIFLHGFPEFWYSWRHQIDFCVEAGYRVIILYKLGYNFSYKPVRISSFSLGDLARDVVGLIDACGQKKASIVAHDWGGMVAWQLAMSFAERIEKLVIMNVPHPKVMLRHLKTNPQQRRRSRYVFLFQLPFLPEWRMRKDSWDYATRALTKTSRPGTFSDADLARYRESWAQPRALTGMINWYRAGVRHRPKLDRQHNISLPILMIWGTQDRFLGKEMAMDSMAFCTNGRLEMLDMAGHWLQHEEPEKVNRLIRAFLA